MYFTDLKKDLNDSDKRVDDINKQRINLSNHACSILLQDMDAFYHQMKIAPGSGVIDSVIINHIFRNFRDDANASLHLSCKRKQEELKRILSGLDASVQKQAIAPLIEEHRRTITEQIRRDLSKKGEAYIIRIRRDNLNFLGNEPFPDWHEGIKNPQAGLYRDKVGNYLKAVIEEYARKSYFEREAIFCKNTLETIRMAIRLSVMLKVTTQNRYVQYVRPYTIQGDPEQLYHYLAGYLAPGPNGPWRLGSIRLSMITDCEDAFESSDIQAEQIAELDAAIRKNGIQFLSDATHTDLPERIVVEFTKQGKQMYHKMLHLRPMYSNRPGELVYEFLVTRQQAESYFFKFGHNVKILEPEDLAEKFRRKYESAAKQYT